ncbi:hypothetical protein, partial [Aquipuribacter hungaricus]|uniref:hypothetical protein n=1 Tax=Aquipuribacter hungaricus TaxID=545624 RepID=UPI0030EBAF24
PPGPAFARQPLAATAAAAAAAGTATSSVLVTPRARPTGTSAHTPPATAHAPVDANDLKTLVRPSSSPR